MKKQELIGRLENFLAPGRLDVLRYQHRNPLQMIIARFFLFYLKKLPIPATGISDLEYYLPSLIVDAFEHFRHDVDADTVALRHKYESVASHGVPNIIDIGSSDPIDQLNAIQTALYVILRDAPNSHLMMMHAENYLTAQRTVVQQAFDKFSRLVYRQGLGELLSGQFCPAMSGQFGQTQLTAIAGVGHILLTFSKIAEEEAVSISFLSENGDPLLICAGIHEAKADLRTCLDMIEEVISHWLSLDPKQQKSLYKAITGVKGLWSTYCS